MKNCYINDCLHKQALFKNDVIIFYLHIIWKLPQWLFYFKCIECVVTSHLKLYDKLYILILHLSWRFISWQVNWGSFTDKSLLTLLPYGDWSSVMQIKLHQHVIYLLFLNIFWGECDKYCVAFDNTINFFMQYVLLYFSCGN